MAADVYVQRVEGLHLIELVAANIAFAQRRHSQIYKGEFQRLTAESADGAVHAITLLRMRFIVSSQCDLFSLSGLKQGHTLRTYQLTICTQIR